MIDISRWHLGEGACRSALPRERFRPTVIDRTI
jgi:hypothetical protein